MFEYNPKGHAKLKDADLISFRESKPPPSLEKLVHRFIEIKTLAPLSEEYRFHALPDACTYAIFDQLNPEITGISQLRIKSQEFCLGKSFHFVNIRFYPAVWQSLEELMFGQIYTKYTGKLPLIVFNNRLRNQCFDAKLNILSNFVILLKEQGIILENTMTIRLLSNVDEIESVKDMANCVGKSPRQFQRILKRTTGMTPRDFLKILRIQKSLTGHPLDNYADQSHFIRSLREMTGHTPKTFEHKYDV